MKCHWVTLIGILKTRGKNSEKEKEMKQQNMEQELFYVIKLQLTSCPLLPETPILPEGP